MQALARLLGIGQATHLFMHGCISFYRMIFNSTFVRASDMAANACCGSRPHLGSAKVLCVRTQFARTP